MNKHIVTILFFAVVGLTCFSNLRFVYGCSCIRITPETLRDMVCESEAFAKVKILGKGTAVPGTDYLHYNAKVEESITGDLEKGDHIVLQTPSSSAGCGATFQAGKSYYVVISADNMVTLCGVFNPENFPKEEVTEEGYCSSTTKCPEKPTCEGDCFECAVNEETGCEAQCCDFLRCAVLACDEQSYLDRSRICCPGECINVCAAVTCLEGSQCRAVTAPCLVPPCPVFGECVEEKPCTRELKVCCDGSTVGRDGFNNCEFFPCPIECEPKFCTADVKLCCDGSFVGRDPENGCAFFPCPRRCQKPGRVCTEDVKECCDNIYVSRNPRKNCKFDPCPPRCNKPHHS